MLYASGFSVKRDAKKFLFFLSKMHCSMFLWCEERTGKLWRYSIMIILLLNYKSFKMFMRWIFYFHARTFEIQKAFSVVQVLRQLFKGHNTIFKWNLNILELVMREESLDQRKLWKKGKKPPKSYSSSFSWMAPFTTP